MLAEQRQDLIAHAVSEAGIDQVYPIYNKRDYKAMSPGLDGIVQSVLGGSTQRQPAESIHLRLHACRWPRLSGSLQVASQLSQVLVRALTLAHGLIAYTFEAVRQSDSEGLLVLCCPDLQDLLCQLAETSRGALTGCGYRGHGVSEGGQQRL